MSVSRREICWRCHVVSIRHNGFHLTSKCSFGGIVYCMCIDDMNLNPVGFDITGL